MKRFITISMICFGPVFFINLARAQVMEKFFYNKGVKDLCEAAHVSNDYVSGTYKIQKNYVDITFESKDKVFDRNITTSIRLMRGFGGLYFTDILVLNDDDIVKPFDAFGLQASLMLAIVKGIDGDSYAKVQQAIIDNFHTNVEQWSGKLWALFGLNLDYIEYQLKN